VSRRQDVLALKKSESELEKPQRIGAIKASLHSVLRALNMGVELGFILLYSWICERAPLFTHGQKFGSFNLFWGLFGLFMLCALGTMKENKNGDDSVLNREQTEEWKGWMQYLFLAYHYFNFHSVYNYVRVFISCYVWLTGFGNLSFFYIKQDYSLLRFLQMMWRLNFLVFFLCLVHGNTWILYYICPLHTFYFVMTYCIMRLGHASNLESQNWLRSKLIALCVFIFIIWEYPLVFYDLWGVFISTEKVIGAKNGTLYEWFFRTGLDHYSAVFGMAFAINFPTLIAWFKRAESLKPGRVIIVKLMICLPFVVGVTIWASTVASKPKFQYNSMHPYFFWIPLLGYIVFRNISAYTRIFHSSLLARMGKVTLETYLMQHHIWLSENAKAVLIFFPGFPLTNMFITTALYIYISNRLFRITIGLRAMLLPDDLAIALRSIGMLFGALAACAGLAVFLRTLEGGLTSVNIVFSIFPLTYFSMKIMNNMTQGEVEYELVSKTDGGSGLNRALLSKRKWTKDFMVSLLIFSGGQFAAEYLKEPDEFMGIGVSGRNNNCATKLGHGTWAPMNSKDDQTCQSYEMCFPEENAKFTWVNLNNIEKALCVSKPRVQASRFSRPKENEYWAKLFSNQVITFVGDSSGRELMKGFVSMLDEATTVKFERHRNTEIELKSTGISLELKWRPFASQVHEYLKNVGPCDPLGSQSAVVIAIGLWDIRWSSSHLDAFSNMLSLIGMEMKRARSVCPKTTYVWMMPTSLNVALLSDDRKVNMTQLNYNRVISLMHQSNILNSFDFVLEADKLTSNKVAMLLGTDGVHYKAPVYRVLAETLGNQIKFDRIPSPKLVFTGIPHNPFFGTIIVSVFCVIVLSAENFIGIGHLVFFTNGLSLISTSESYVVFHNQHGLN
jgi:hypothetical protein